LQATEEELKETEKVKAQEKEKHVTLMLTQQWFDKVSSGEKNWELRAAKPFWTKRFDGATHVRFQLGSFAALIH